MTTELRENNLSGMPSDLPADILNNGGAASDGGTSGAAGPTMTAPPREALEARSESGPALDGPPQAAEEGARSEGATASTWRSGTVTATWSIDENRNAWMQVEGLGWRKLFNGNDGAFTALLILATQARQTGRSIRFREEADGMIYEIYLW